MTDVAVFTHRSVIEARAAEVFRWHERPEALTALMPRRFIRIDSRSGGVRDGARLVFSFGVGPLRLTWEARHYGYVRNEQFCDEQVRGPFRVWRHTHRVEPIGSAQTLYTDHVEFAVFGGRLVQRVMAPVIKLLLARSFSQRHATVRAQFPPRVTSSHSGSTGVPFGGPSTH